MESKGGFNDVGMSASIAGIFLQTVQHHCPELGGGNLPRKNNKFLGAEMTWDIEHGCLQCNLRQEEGIAGTIKNLWEDFHVREIRKDGSICQLEELVSTDDLRKARLDEVHKESGKDILENTFQLNDVQKQVLLETAHLTPSDLNVLEMWINQMREYRLSALDQKRQENSEPVEKAETEEAANESTTNEMNNEANGGSKQGRESVELSKWGVSTELLRKELGHCHCLLVGKIETGISKDTLKRYRKEMHDAIRLVLPFITSDTLTTGDAYEVQNGKTVPTVTSRDLDPSLDGETREALCLKRSHFTTLLQTRFQLVRVPPGSFVRQEDLPVLDSSEEGDRFRFVRVQMRPACIAWLLGRPLDSPSLMRYNWTSESRWPKGHPQYLHFIMHKCNKDTSEAISRIAACVGCRPKCFSFAGTKDKRGVTCQVVSGFKMSVEQFKSSMTKKEWDRQIRCSNFEYKAHTVKLGHLKGNHFKLVVREIPLNQVDRIPSLCDHLAQHGFINYFGMQRFGTGKVKTWQVGAVLLAQQYENAVRLILGDTERRDAVFAENPVLKLENETAGDSTTASTEELPSLHETELEASPDKQLKAEEEMAEETQTQKEPKEEKMNEEPCPKKRKLNDVEGMDWYLKRGDASKALQALPKWCYNEKLILTSLVSEPRSFVGALLRLTKTSLGLYCHAAQSLVWNAMASERIQRFGTQRVVVGDLVRVRELNIPDDENANSDEEQDLTADESLAPSRYEVCEVESEEVAAKFTIFDVVLPLPGEDVIYPSILADSYRKFCQAVLKVGLESFVSDKHGLCHLCGSYRPVIQRAEHVTFRVLKPGEFDNETYPRKPILASDLDRLLGKEVAQKDDFVDFLKPIKCVLDTPLSATRVVNEDARRLPTNTAALLLSCSLPKSSYLTCAIREIIEGDFTSKMDPNLAPLPKENRRNRGGSSTREGRGGGSRGVGGSRGRGGNRRGR
eukprot:Gregarina_sp_Poly_1__479@NODE_1115_length_5039_cov_76_496380_g636_i1_p1_GENE_NODE_1115_length_5039_cov_76_496380_g636_i1NODE_1115_length_5039_cov_76_496380_g636_i1_p1_ORF_typecomplete_len964_score156_98TruD/PF01142_18/2_8e56TruD/PF01142_18/9_9e33_NODE_1115_length_5039_cov_76_496380_g636_i118074698